MAENWQGYVSALGGLVAILSYITEFQELQFVAIGGLIAIIFGIWSANPNIGKKQ